MDFDTPSHLLLRRGLSHEDPFVRNESILSLCDNPLRSTEDSDEILKQWEVHGPERFEFIHSACTFPLDENRTERLMALCREWHSRGLREEVARIFQWFLRSPEKVFSQVLELAQELYLPPSKFPHLDPKRFIATLKVQMSLAGLGPELLLQELRDEIDKIGTPKDFPHPQWEVIQLICDRLGDFTESNDVRQITRDWLDLPMDPDEATPNDWKTLTGVYLAGTLRLIDSADRLIDLLEPDWDVLNEQIEGAFTRMNDPEALERIHRRWSSLPQHGQLFLSTPFEILHPSRFRDFYLETIHDEDVDADCGFSLSVALLQLGDREALDAAAKHYLDYDLWDPEVLDHASLLRTHLILRGHRPELAAQIGSLLTERETETGLPSRFSFQSKQPPAPIRNENKIGRNDPCPCGSGKKYKKCCLRLELN